MTTTVTVTTHDWPVSVNTNSNHSYGDEQKYGYSQSSNTEFVPANTTKQFSVSDTTSLHISELPKDATGLSGGSGTLANAASGAVTAINTDEMPGDVAAVVDAEAEPAA
ncbi:hypothetical protein [Sphingomonas paeninsulae]|uniref:hypothetical protein n=1 Tax=Sphingomonas paeninsulae TaxID=2319844 RepID=UPI0013CE6A15|nr:hypothetical protein [Sphingomonas paeninsulae]